ncbi:unnamed protein product [Brugia timori]|uniref:Bm13094, isoform b n=2 Tax=Brugia TaxID=6278 RepID=A0A1I9G254_BRUMA|nr:Bm13094, isoform b [Brugia malayi]VDO21269.1 unnamed protein product [Brugia timori]
MVVINAFIMDMKRKDVRSADKETGYVDNATFDLDIAINW